MRVKSAFKFQAREILGTVLALYGCLAVLNIIGILAKDVLNIHVGIVKNGSTAIGVSGTEIIAMVTALILALSSFREEFQMLIQNGISRKCVFLSRLAAGAALAATMSAADIVFRLFSKGLEMISGTAVYASPFWEMVYPQFWETHSAFLTWIVYFVMGLLFYVLMYMVGTAMSALFYRLGKRGRTVMAAGLPIFIFVVLPIALEYFGGTAVITWLVDVFLTLAGLKIQNPWPAMVTAAVLTCLFGALGWITVRRAAAKE